MSALHRPLVSLPSLFSNNFYKSIHWCAYFRCRFYIGCDVCQDWFHGTCVGITQAEADFIENYVCPRCSSVNAGERIENKALSQKDIEGLKRLLRSLQVCIKL